MNATRKQTALQEAYARASVGREMLRRVAGPDNYRIMEQVDDKCGVHIERWILATAGDWKNTVTQVLLWATPQGWDVFIESTRQNSLEATEKALRQAMT